MYQVNRVLLEGVEDMKPEIYSQKLKVQDKIRSIFNENSFKEIQTPSFEYYDVLSEIRGVEKEAMVKVIDDDGKIMVLRPDATIPVARMAMEQRGEEIQKYAYLTNIFRRVETNQSEKREFTQAGIEVFGSSDISCDVEVIRVGIDAMRAIGVEDFTIEIGDFRFISDALRDIKDIDLRQKLVNKIRKKDTTGLKALLENTNLEESLKNCILKVPKLYGNPREVIKIARLVAKTQMQLEVLNRLEELIDLLESKGYKRYLKIDLGLDKTLDYYSGLIFNGYIDGMGEVIINGGRYDELTKNFGVKMPACGLGIYIDKLLIALEKQGLHRQESFKKDVIKIAIAKGRLAELALELFKEVGVIFPEYSKKSRKLVFVDEKKEFELILVKSMDVGVYVEKGTVDIGIVGQDVLLETVSDVFEIMGLGFGKCRICVCGAKEKVQNVRKKLVVGTKYPNVTRQHYNNIGKGVEIIKLNGSVELAPILGLSDVIIDIVETGKTLKENGLEVLETLCESSATLIANKVSLKVKKEKMETFINAIEKEIVRRTLDEENSFK